MIAAVPQPTPTTDMPMIAASMPESCGEGIPDIDDGSASARSREFGATATGSDRRVSSTARDAAMVSSCAGTAAPVSGDGTGATGARRVVVEVDDDPLAGCWPVSGSEPAPVDTPPLGTPALTLGFGVALGVGLALGEGVGDVLGSGDGVADGPGVGTVVSEG